MMEEGKGKGGEGKGGGMGIERQGKIGKWRGKRREIVEENLKLKGRGKLKKGMKMSRGPFFLLVTFLKPLKFFCGVPKWKFLGKIF